MGASGSRVDNGFIDECLRAHNVYRTRHGVAPLTHDPALSHSAQVFLISSNTGNFEKCLFFN